MSLSSPELARVVEEIAPKIEGQRVRKVFQLGPETVALEIRNPRFIVLSVHPKVARIHTAEKIEKWGKTPKFGAFLRKHVAGLFIGGLEKVPGDRVLKLSFVGEEEMTLVAEMTGRFGDMIVVDGDDKVRCVLHDERKRSRNRGDDLYRLPPPPPPSLLKKDKDRFAESGGLYDHAIAAFYSNELESLGKEHKTKNLQKALRRKRKSLKTRLQRLERDLEKAGETAPHQKWADLLLANAHSLPSGASDAKVTDLFEGKGEVIIPLDPKKSVVENADRYYESRRKGARTEKTAQKRKDLTLKELDRVESLIQEVSTADQKERLDGLMEEAQALGVDLLGAGKGDLSKGDKKKEKRRPYRVYASQSGKRILVGRSARDNQELTFHVARGRDLWLHVSERSGPHVIVRLEKGESVDGETLLDAATLAVYSALHRRTGSAEVLYTKKKNVRPVKGAPGTVTLSSPKAINLRMEEQRLERLLATRQI